MEILAAITVSLIVGAVLGVVFSRETARVALLRDLGQLWAWMVTPAFAETPEEYVGRHRTVEVEELVEVAELGLGVQ